MVLISQVVLFVLYYQIFKVFNTQNLIISTLSVVASVVLTYLFARRSEYGFIGYVINDIIIIVLWGLPVIRGDVSVIPVLLCPVLLLINDTYGVHNWREIKRRQRRFRKQCKYKNSNANGRIKQGDQQEKFGSHVTGNI